MSYSQQSSTATTKRSGPPYLPSEIDFSKITYSEPKQNGNSPARIAYVNYDGGKLVVEAPWMTSPFGIRQPPPEYRDEGAPPKYSVEFSLKGYRGEDPEVQQMYAMLNGFQDKILEDSCTYSSEWHKKKNMSKDVAEALFTPLVRLPKDKNTGEVTDMYPPTFKLKVPYWEGEFKSKVMQKGSGTFLEGDLSEQVGGRLNARVIMECSSLWFVAGKFGATWNLKIMEYESLGQPQLTSYAFRDPTPVDTNQVDQVVVADDVKENTVDEVDDEVEDEVEDSDDE